MASDALVDVDVAVFADDIAAQGLVYLRPAVVASVAQFRLFQYASVCQITQGVAAAVQQLHRFVGVHPIPCLNCVFHNGYLLYYFDAKINILFWRRCEYFCWVVYASVVRLLDVAFVSSVC